jgi:uncharacterized SAM-binding protein YcdF (DUF218 family)
MKKLLENIFHCDEEEAIIVLGGSNERFRKRLKKAVELCEKSGESFLFIAGQDIYSDAETMKILENNGNYLHENRSVNTYDNAVNSLEILKTLKNNYFRNALYGECDSCKNISRVTVVTDTLHMPRARRYFKKVYGDEFKLLFAAVTEDRKDLPRKIIYESAGYLVSFLPNKYINSAKRIKNRYLPWV